MTEADIDLQVSVDKPEGTIAFTNGRIITMRGEEVIERGFCLIEGNRIVAVGRPTEVVVPATAKVIDIAGKTLLPGLVDMHGHLDIGDEDALMPNKHPGHYAALAFGVTTNFDPASSELPSFAASEMNLAGIAVGPRLISAGSIIYGMESRSVSPYP